VRQAALIAEGATVALDKPAQEIGQQTDEGLHAHLLICPRVLRAHGQVIHILELPERRLKI
jgi:hypothetical protein